MSIFYKFIARGGYGFVVHPSINNDNIYSDIIDDKYNLNSVSKIFLSECNEEEDNKNNAKNEYDNHIKIDKIDPCYKYHLKVLEPKRYNFIKNEILNKINIKNLPEYYSNILLDNKFNYIYYINYEFGGLTLFDLFINNEKKVIIYKKEMYIHICKEMYRLMEFIKLLLENKYVHHDLKNNNILIDNNMCFKVIDFGMIEYIPNYIKNCELGEIYPLFVYYPFEIEYYEKSNYNNYDEVYNKKNYIKYLNKLKNIYNRFFNNYYIKIYQKEYEDMIKNIKNKSYHEFMNTSIISFDIYTLGLTLVFLTEKYTINDISKKKRYYDDYSDCFSENIYNDYIHFYKLKEIIIKMITPNVFERIKIDDLLIEYKNYIDIISI